HVQPDALDAAARRVGLGGAELTDERAQRPPQFQWASRRVALPERHPGRLAGHGRRDDPVVGDVDDLPGCRTQQERIAHPGLVDHLLVEFTDARARPVSTAGRHDGEQTAVRDGAAGGDRQPLRSWPAAQLVADPVPDYPWAQLAEVL